MSQLIFFFPRLKPLVLNQDPGKLAVSSLTAPIVLPCVVTARKLLESTLPRTEGSVKAPSIV